MSYQGNNSTKHTQPKAEKIFYFIQLSSRRDADGVTTKRYRGRETSGYSRAVLIVVAGVQVHPQISSPQCNFPHLFKTVLGWISSPSDFFDLGYTSKTAPCQSLSSKVHNAQW